MSFTDEKFNLYNEYAERNALSTVWSMYEVTDFDTPSNITATTLVYADHWGTVRNIEVNMPCGNKTWGQLYTAADRAIRQSGDTHHVFIERFRVEGDVVYLTTGS